MRAVDLDAVATEPLGQRRALAECGDDGADIGLAGAVANLFGRRPRPAIERQEDARWAERLLAGIGRVARPAGGAGMIELRQETGAAGLHRRRDAAPHRLGRSRLHPGIFGGARGAGMRDPGRVGQDQADAARGTLREIVDIGGIGHAIACEAARHRRHHHAVAQIEAG